MAISLEIEMVDRATPVLQGFQAEADRALGRVADVAEKTAASIDSAFDRLALSFERTVGQARALSRISLPNIGLVKEGEEAREAAEAMGELESRAGALEGWYGDLGEANQALTEKVGEATLGLQKQAAAISSLGTETDAAIQSLTESAGKASQTQAKLQRASKDDVRAFFSNFELISSAFTSKQLEENTKKIMANLAQMVSLSRALGPARFSFNEAQTFRVLNEAIRARADLIQLMEAGAATGDVGLVAQIPRRPPIILGTFFQSGGMVSGPFGIAEQGEFVVRREAVRDNRELLEAINRGLRPTPTVAFTINVQGEGRGLDWRGITRREILPEIRRVLERG